MHHKTKEKLTDIAPNIIKYLDLDPHEKEWLFPLLGDAQKTAIEVIETCSDRELSYKEIARLVNIHPNTAKQIIYALAEGGVSFSFDRQSAKYFPTGRPRVSIAIKNKI